MDNDCKITIELTEQEIDDVMFALSDAQYAHTKYSARQRARLNVEKAKRVDRLIDLQIKIVRLMRVVLL